jgi:hypothetical protein
MPAPESQHNSTLGHLDTLIRARILELAIVGQPNQLTIYPIYGNESRDFFSHRTAAQDKRGLPRGLQA